MTTARSASTIFGFCAAAALGAALAVLYGHAAASAPDERWQLAARYTARFAFAVFLPVFVASAWNRLAPGRVSRFLVRRRRALGLAFATAHTVHLAALVAANAVAGTRPDAVTIAVGGGAYLVLFAMAATSNDASVRRLGRNWLRLHKLGVYWIWFVFTFSYAGRTFGGQPEFAPWFAAALAALVLRIVAARRAGGGLVRNVLGGRRSAASRGESGGRLRIVSAESPASARHARFAGSAARQPSSDRRNSRRVVQRRAQFSSIAYTRAPARALLPVVHAELDPPQPREENRT